MTIASAALYPAGRFKRYLATPLCSAALLLASAAGADSQSNVFDRNASVTPPNLVFIVDTSGSMSNEVVVDDSYDPNAVYPGPFQDATRLYFSPTAPGGFVFPDENYAASGNYVNRPAFVCATGNTQLADDGYYLDRFVQFDGTQWTIVRPFDSDPASSGVDRFTECFSDDGVHGLTAGSDAVFPVNGPLTDARPIPWSNDPAAADRVDWLSWQTHFVFFEPNFLNWLHWSESNGNPAVRSRLGLVQDALFELIDGLAALDGPDAIVPNVGLMRFSTNGQGGMVVHAVEPPAGALGSLLPVIASWQPASSTLLAETLFEAFQYLRGGPVVFGLSSEPVLSVAESYDGGTYLSPIGQACQKNNILLIGDGLRTSDTDADSDIYQLIGAPCVGSCLDELAVFMDQWDFVPGLDGAQTVQTYTISLVPDLALLQDTATGIITIDDNGQPLANPEPGYFFAADVAALDVALNTIVNQIRGTAAPEPGIGACDDLDADGVTNSEDNCTLIANVGQRDSNGDGYGNRCDADLNSDGTTNAVDLGLFRLAFFTTNADADFDGDGKVNSVDLGIMRSLFFAPPGPSGLSL